jgi:translation initiation factor IF-2
MTKRLIKIATEFNVGTTTIVDYLNNIGYDIENKPTAKITDEMYDELLKEFQKSKEIAIKANQLIIGRSTTSAPLKKETPAAEPRSPFKEPELRKPDETESAAPKEKEDSVEERARFQPRLKAFGKIDLESRLRGKTSSTSAIEEVEKPAPPPAPEKEKEEIAKPALPEETREAAKAPAKPEEKQPKEQAEAEQKPTPPKTEPALPAAEPPEAQTKKKTPAYEDLIRAETPELRGLKILGKIDTDKFSRPKKKKKKEKEREKPKLAPDNKAPKSDTPTPKAPDTADEAQKKKRRRKRKKVQAPAVNPTSAGGGDPKRAGSRPLKKDDLKEVSQREIDEKIKMTMARMSGGGKKRRQRLQRDKRERMREKEELRQAEQHTDKLEVTEFISVQELANIMDVPVADVITTCMNLGVIVSINQRLDAEIIELVASEFSHEVEFISVEEQVDDEDDIIDDPEDLQPRAPIVTVMGHVDHGKTSLLDFIRHANVVGGEAGGITQHIGAYEVVVGDEKKTITFLDTPGHEAFTAMRARGAKLTDIAIIVIAADDSIMPQTREAISHAQAAGVPIIFAINKIDKPGADPNKIKQDLSAMNFLVEEWGGKYQSQDLSAKTGEGIPELLEKILLEAELLELKANPDRPAFGTVIEASLEKGRGYVTKVLVQTGTLQVGDPLVAGEYSGKVKAMFNERNKRVKSAGPSKPVLVLGLDGAPQAGERFKVVDSEQDARQIASKRAQIVREQANRATKRISLDEIGRRLALGNFKELNLIVKADMDGSVEALSDALLKLSIESIQINVIHKAVGGIIESDVLLASASDAIVIGFQVRPSLSARKLAEQEGVEIKTYSIIYEAIEEIKAAMEGMLEPTKVENITAQVEVREVYKISKVGTVAGCYMLEGKITRNSNIRLIRDGIVVFPTREGAHGKISSLKRFKDDVKEVKSGLECGISIENFNDIKVGDIIEGYEIIEIKQKLN